MYMYACEEFKKAVVVGVGCTIFGICIGYKLRQWHQVKNKSLLKIGNERLIQKTYECLPHLDRTIDEYVVKHSLREPTALKELREMTLKRFPGDPLIIDPIEAQLFQMLLHMLDARKCMEVGAFTGYNAANMALALPEDGEVVVCDITKKYLNAGREYIEKLGPHIWDKMTIFIQPALKTMDQFIEKGELFDFIFLDAEWTICAMYFEKALKLIRTGGMIAIDNTLCSGRVTFSSSFECISDSALRKELEAIHEMNVKLKSDKRVELVFLKIADGVTLCRKI